MSWLNQRLAVTARPEFPWQQGLVLLRPRKKDQAGHGSGSSYRLDVYLFFSRTVSYASAKVNDTLSNKGSVLCYHGDRVRLRPSAQY